VKETVEAMDAHDAARLADCYTEDAVRETIGMAVQRGREEIRDFYQMAFTGIPDARIRLISLMADDDGAWLEWEETGTNTGVSRRYDGNVAEGTGKSYTARVAVHDTIRNGKIVERRLFVNYLNVFSQLGLLPTQ
jgi:ketosteroid isomerase-like protein